MASTLNSIWTEPNDTRLRKSWADGLSASQIGDAMGTTRNAVIGRAHRLGLSRERTTAPSGTVAQRWWTAERTALLTRRWAEGASAAEIAGQLETSRSKICAKVFRLKLPKRATVSSKPLKAFDYAKDTSLAARAVARKKRAEDLAAEVIDLPPDQSPDAVTFLERRTGQCAWPLNDVTPIDGHMACGSRCHGEHSYCRRHHLLSIGRPTPQLSDEERQRRIQHSRRNFKAMAIERVTSALA